jgi:hypothetical protein
LVEHVVVLDGTLVGTAVLVAVLLMVQEVHQAEPLKTVKDFQAVAEFKAVAMQVVVVVVQMELAAMAYIFMVATEARVKKTQFLEHHTIGLAVAGALLALAVVE